MNLQLCMFLLLVGVFSGNFGTDENDNEADENYSDTSFCILDENDNEASKKDKESTDKMLQLEQKTENLPNEIQEIQQQNLKEKDATGKMLQLEQNAENLSNEIQDVQQQNLKEKDENLQSDQKMDVQKILKKFKIQETIHKLWPMGTRCEFDVAENSLGFEIYPNRRTMLWQSKALEKNFPLSFSHKGNTYKLKSCNACFKLKSAGFFHPGLQQENQITIVYRNEFPHWHATFPKYLKSLFSDSDTIYLKLTQVQQLAEKPKSTCAVCKLFLESEEKTQNQIYISAMHNNVEISDQLQNLLENSTKLDFENLKKLWEEIDTTNVAKIVAREKKHAMIVRFSVSSVLAVSLFSFFYNYISNDLARDVERGLLPPNLVISLIISLLICSIPFIVLLLMMPDALLHKKLRAKTLQKFTKY